MTSNAPNVAAAAGMLLNCQPEKRLAIGDNMPSNYCDKVDQVMDKYRKKI